MLTSFGVGNLVFDWSGKTIATKKSYISIWRQRWFSGEKNTILYTNASNNGSWMQLFIDSGILHAAYLQLWGFGWLGYTWDRVLQELSRNRHQIYVQMPLNRLFLLLACKFGKLGIFFGDANFEGPGARSTEPKPGSHYCSTRLGSTIIFYFNASILNKQVKRVNRSWTFG